MARAGDEVRIKPSLLDRLLDDESPQPVSRSFQSIGQVRQAVARDLGLLLNTRQEAIEPLPEDFSELQRSLLSYGLPDFTTCNLRNAADRDRIRRALQQAIGAFEPRLDRVRVESKDDDSGEGSNEHGQFVIRAVLQVKPLRQQDVFVAEIQPASGTIDVKAN